MSLIKARVLLTMTMMMSLGVGALAGQDGQKQDGEKEMLARATTRVEAIYPDLARKMRISGTVKVRVVVAPNGTVKDAKVVGGHPVLADAAVEAARKWRFEPAATETTGIVEFKFEPHR